MPLADLRIHEHASPNHGPRRNGLTATHVVLHYTAMDSSDAAIARLSDPEAEVSAHYVICKSGAVTRLVPEEQRAWHAGAGEWAGLDDMNSRSIGIELDNDGCSPFAFALMDALELLLADILQRWRIPAANVIGHSDMAPGRKFDPGPWFDWVRLEANGLAQPRGNEASHQDITMPAFAACARDHGFTAQVDDETLLSAVRLRFRSFATGPLSPDDFVPIGQGSPTDTHVRR